MMIDMPTHKPPHRARHVIGTMTGTSIDGIDIAIARITGSGLSMHAKLIAHSSRSLGEIGGTLRRLAEGKAMTAQQIARAAWSFGELHAELIHAVLTEHARIEPPVLIAVHGQTIFHQPPISWQLINPAPIAARFDCPVVFDLRQADLAAGGQGAPITPIADWIMFRHESNRRAIVNLGGFCNITILPSAVARPSRSCDESAQPLEDIHGFDLCACNHLLDAIAKRTLNAPYDDGGEDGRKRQSR
jgi:anhydro-N-acetylmuramic acid kinase